MPNRTGYTHIRIHIQIVKGVFYTSTSTEQLTGFEVLVSLISFSARLVPVGVYQRDQAFGHELGSEDTDAFRVRPKLGSLGRFASIASHVELLSIYLSSI